MSADFSELKIYEYEIPLRKELKLQRGVLRERKGLILEHHGIYAEISPLPEFSRENLADAKNEIITFRNFIGSEHADACISDSGESGKRNEILQYAMSALKPQCPSVQFAIWMLMHPLSGVSRKSAYDFILGNPSESLALFRKIVSRYEAERQCYGENVKSGLSVCGNSEAGNDGSGEYPERIIKLKIGLYPRNDELMMLKEMVKILEEHEKTSSVRIRMVLDANLSLTPESISDYFRTTADFIRYIEDPCQDIAGLRRIRHDLPVGFDELFRSGQEGGMLSAMKALSSSDTLVVKPGLTDNIHELLNLYLNRNSMRNVPLNMITDDSTDSDTENHPDNDYRILNLPGLTLSSAFETAVGIDYIERLSEFLGLNPPGTDTLKFFPDDSLTAKQIINRYSRKLH